MDANERGSNDVWAIVEIMGHSRFAGRVSECQAFGAPLIRVEVPEVDDQPGFEKHFGPASIFAITPTSEAYARAAAAAFRSRPLALVELSEIAARPALPRPDPMFGDEEDES
jgi:hypothetical protein